MRAWGLVPAAVDERRVADGLLAGTRPAGLPLDRGFLGRRWAAGYAARGTQAVSAHSHAQRQTLPAAERRPVAGLRHRIETTIGALTAHLGLAGHGAKPSWGLLTRVAAPWLARTLLRLTPV